MFLPLLTLVCVVLVGFVVFLAFTSYDQSRTGAEQEALIIVQQVENAQAFPRPAAAQLTGELICYGRSVVNGEWGQTQAGTQGDAINPWGVKMFRTLQGVNPQTGEKIQIAASRVPRFSAGSSLKSAVKSGA